MRKRDKPPKPVEVVPRPVPWPDGTLPGVTSRNLAASFKWVGGETIPDGQVVDGKYELRYHIDVSIDEDGYEVVVISLAREIPTSVQVAFKDRWWDYKRRKWQSKAITDWMPLEYGKQEARIRYRPVQPRPQAVGSGCLLSAITAPFLALRRRR